MNQAWVDLTDSVSQEASQAIEGDAASWIEYLKSFCGVRAVLYYGSGLRPREDHSDGSAGKSARDGQAIKGIKPGNEVVEDFYLLVDAYRSFGKGRGLAMAGSLLPPNVYFFEKDFGGGTSRCKCAVIRVDQFLSAARGEAFTPHIWARFAQPFRIGYTDSASLRKELIQACAKSVALLYRRGKAFAPGGCANRSEIWKAGLRSTYADELRAENSDYIDQLYERNAELYGEWARLCEIAGIADWAADSPKARRLRWRVVGVRPARKAVVVARLVKAAFTFQGGLEYAQWKIRKQSGKHFKLSEFDHRHPLLGGLRLFGRVLRERGLR